MNKGEYVDTFTIRRSFLLPLGILLLEAVVLFAVVLAQGAGTAKAVVLGILLIPVSGLFAESYFRRLVIGADRVTAFRPFRQKSFAYADIVSVETIQVKKRVFLTISTEESFLIISNAYANFPELVQSLLEKVPEETIASETAAMAEAPPLKSSDIVSCWFGVILLAIILALQFV